jgi:transcriptional regulator with XRE-family HTH domain
MNLRSQLLEKFQDKEYRDSFVQEFIFSRIPLKIRAIRDKRRMSQADLGEKARVAQAWVSKLEDPNYGRLTLSTLLKIASAFDCGLSVDFVPFSRILNDATSLSSESFNVPSFVEDGALANGSSPSGFADYQNLISNRMQAIFANNLNQNPTSTSTTCLLENEESGLGAGNRSRYYNYIIFSDATTNPRERAGRQSLAHLGAPFGNQQEGGLSHEAFGGHPS